MNTTDAVETPAPRKCRRLNPWHAAFVAFAVALFLFLSVRGTDPDRWSDWGFGDAQTLLTLRQWNEGGWLANYLLFIPQGYAKVIKHLDEPGLRQHAHGTCEGSSPRVGPRLWYTHYPAGYLVPYAALFRVGLDSMPAARVLSVILSIAALGLMYLLFARIVSPPAAFAASVFYGLAPVFLGYADSLANQPIDDLCRFGFMMCVVLSTRAGTDRERRLASTAAWLIEFCLSLSSFDSVFFVYVWLVGWDLLEGRFRWKRYLVFGFAPVTAHGLQFLQNVWYLGWRDAAIDIRDAFLLKAGAAEASWLQTLRLSVRTVFDNTFSKTPLLWAMGALLVLRRLLLRWTDGDAVPKLRLLLLVFLAGLAYIVVLPHGARMPYQGRQMLPFVALLFGGVAGAVVESYRALGRSKDDDAAPGGLRTLVEAPWLLAAVVTVFVTGIYFGIAPRKPLYTMDRFGSDVALAKSLPTLPTAREPVYLDLDGFQVFWNPAYAPGFPQIMPLLEYYAGSRAILCFNDERNLVADLVSLLNRGGKSFSPVLVARDQNRLRNLTESLVQGGVLREMPPGAYPSSGRFVIDLTPYLR